MRRWPWQDEFGDTSPGWVLTLFVSVIFAAALAVQWINEQHMSGLF